MSESQISTSVQVNIEDFETCDWKKVLSQTSREGYFGMQEAFSSAAKQAIEEEKGAHGQIFQLFAKACSMMLNPRSFNEPFQPMFVGDGYRSAIPDDFSEENILFFSKIVDHIDDMLLKARLSDLIWLKRRDLGVKFALAAIDAYRSVPLKAEVLDRDGRECWERALFLARMLKKGAENLLKEMEEAIINSFNATKREDDFFALWLSDLLKEYGLAHEHSNSIAEKLESFAKEFEQSSDFYSRGYLKA